MQGVQPEAGVSNSSPLVCALCEQKAPIVAAYANGRQRVTKYCWECRTLYRKVWYQNNRERVQAEAKQKRASNLEAVREYERESSRRYRERNRERKRLSARTWKRKHKNKVNAVTASRRAKRHQATPKWANQEEIRRIYAEAARMTAESGIQYHVDHIVPLKSNYVCGLHCEANLQIITWEENQRKSNRWWPDMAENLEDLEPWQPQPDKA